MTEDRGCLDGVTDGREELWLTSWFVASVTGLKAGPFMRQEEKLILRLKCPVQFQLCWV